MYRDKRWPNLPEELHEELLKIKQLRSDHTGPIAETYEQLQGILFLQHARLSESCAHSETRVYLALSQACLIAHLNIRHLVNRASQVFRTGAITPTMYDISSDLRWAYSIAKISLGLTISANQFYSHALPEYKSSTGERMPYESLSELQQLEDSLVADERRISKITGAIRSGYNLEALPVIVHETKNLRNFLSVEHAKAKPIPPRKYLQKEILDACVHSLNTRITSYLMQFRLLHQIPEILGAEAVDLIASATDLVCAGRFEDASEKIGITVALMNHICSSMIPLIELMYPSEYYSIRGNLGITSGSKSETISVNLIRNTFKNFVKAISDNPESLSFTPFAKSAAEIRESLDLWRELHLMLPKNVLGFDTTSLIGSPNAPQTVRKLKQGFDRSREIKRIDAELKSAPATQTDMEFSALTELTGVVTRDKFKKVEERRIKK